MKGILTFWQFELNLLFLPILKKAVLVFRPFTRLLVVLLCESGAWWPTPGVLRLAWLQDWMSGALRFYSQCS